MGFDTSAAEDALQERIWSRLSSRSESTLGLVPYVTATPVRFHAFPVPAALASMAIDIELPPSGMRSPSTLTFRVHLVTPQVTMEMNKVTMVRLILST